MWCGGATERGRERLKSDSDCSGYDEEYRIVLVGAKDVGKTDLTVIQTLSLSQVRTELVAVEDLPFKGRALRWLSEREKEQLWECPVCSDASLATKIKPESPICQVYVGGKEQDIMCDRLVIQKSAKLRRAEFCTWDTVDGQTCCMRLSELHMASTVTPQNVGDDPIIKSLTQRADGFLLIYSVTDSDSFWATSNYYELIMELRSHVDTPLVFIAHKNDCIKGQVVPSSKGRDAAFEIGASYYETSVRADPEGIKFVFHDVIRQVRSVRSHARTQEQSCNKVRGLIHRLSLKSKRKRSKSRSRQKLTSAEQVPGQS